MLEYIIIIILLINLILLLNWKIGKKESNKNKEEIYECGFKSYGRIRERINIKYYIVGILFIIFDIEVMFIYPYTQVNIGIKELSIFLLILIIGLIYEIKKGIIS